MRLERGGQFRKSMMSFLRTKNINKMQIKKNKHNSYRIFVPQQVKLMCLDSLKLMVIYIYKRNHNVTGWLQVFSRKKIATCIHTQSSTW